MPPLPAINADILSRVLERHGWVFQRQRGSHRIYTKDGASRPIPIPHHGNNPLKPGTVRAILRQASISRDEAVETIRSL
ncbi:MAG: type II toxin-antitoxin system HicA family toxin [Candidatus Poribacteria bacterium]|nr:type II toxin-antitoxin system HicA family toxin [Candidatus Poribacteria bacterium]